MFKKIISDLEKVSSSKKALHSAKFFKTGKGEYGEGDLFRGVVVPEQRKIAKKYQDIDLQQLEKLLQSKYHEDRLTALFILILKFKKAKKENIKQEIYKLYLKNLKHINNWDLVDSSAPHIVGNYLLNKDKALLYEYAKSDKLWTKRIAMISCFEFIKNNKFTDTINIAEILVYDKEDLIQKAVGWMLREIGKRDIDIERKFLARFASTMPRTMLRYSLEKFSKEEKQKYMQF